MIPSLLFPLDLKLYAQHSLQPRPSMSLSTVSPGKLAWNLGLVSSKLLEKLGIVPATSGLYVQEDLTTIYATEASHV